MGTWGPGIFEDDVALDVRDIFMDALSESSDIVAASNSVLEEFKDMLDDMDDGPVIILALATLQLKEQALQPEIRARALEIISTGEGLQRWIEAGSVTLDERKQVLQRLKTELSY